MRSEYTAIPDAEVPVGADPAFRHTVTTYASEVNKTVGVWRAVGEWRVRRLMAKIREAAVKFTERQGDDAVLAAINRLTRTDEWTGGRARVAA
jgi:hypothetical protein